LSQIAPNFGHYSLSQILKGQCTPKFVRTLSAPLSITSHGKVSLSYSYMVFRKSRSGWVRFHRIISVSDVPMFTQLLSLNAGGIAVQNFLVWFWRSSFVLKIFAAKL